MNGSDTLILRPDNKKWFGIFVLCAALSAAGIWMIFGGVSVWGWIVFLVFDTGAILSVFALLPNSSYLLLTPQGFTYRSLLRARSFRW